MMNLSGPEEIIMLPAEIVFIPVHNTAVELEMFLFAPSHFTAVSMVS